MVRTAFDDFREEETQTLCPICRGSGKLNIKCTAPSQYSYTVCKFCKGEGCVSASKARMTAVNI